MALQIDENTEMNYLAPLVMADGNLIGYNGQAGIANLLFYQTRRQSGEHVDKVDVVAAVYMPSLQALKDYRDAITSVIDQEEKGNPEP